MFVKILLHLINVNYLYGGVGEVVNTLVCGTSMRGFDSHTPPHLCVELEHPKSVLFSCFSLVTSIYIIIAILKGDEAL